MLSATMALGLVTLAPSLWSMVELPSGRDPMVAAVGGGEWIVMWNGGTLARLDRSENMTLQPITVDTAGIDPDGGREAISWNGTQLAWAFSDDDTTGAYLVLLDRDGARQAGPVEISDGGASRDIRVTDLAWGDGELAAGYSFYAGGSLPSSIWVRRLDAGGQPIGPETKVWEPAQTESLDGPWVAFSEGYLGVAWKVGWNNPEELMAAVFDAAGNLVFPPTIISSMLSDNDHADIAGFFAVSGGFGIAWSETGASRTSLQLMNFDPRGSVLVPRHEPFRNPYYLASDYVVVPAGGGIGVAQPGGALCPDRTCVFRRGVSADGRFASPEIQVTTEVSPEFHYSHDVAVQDSIYGVVLEARESYTSNRLFFGIAPGSGLWAAAPGPSPASPPRVQVYPGAPGAPPAGTTIVPYGTISYGAEVGSADLDGDALGEILTGPGSGPGYGPQVRGFRLDGSTIAKVNFYAYQTLQYGVRPAGADLLGDPSQEILTAPGPGDVFGPHVRGFDFGASGISALARVSFYAFGTPQFGAYVAAGDVDGDGFDEILCGPGPGVGFPSQLRGFDFDASRLDPISGIDAIVYPGSGLGLTVAAGGLLDDGRDQIATGPGPDRVGAELALFRYDGVGLSELPESRVLAFVGVTGGARLAIGQWRGEDFQQEILAAGGPLPGVSGEVRVLALGTSGYELIQPYDPYPGTSHGAIVAAIETGF